MFSGGDVIDEDVDGDDGDSDGDNCGGSSGDGGFHYGNSVSGTMVIE